MCTSQVVDEDGRDESQQETERTDMHRLDPGGTRRAQGEEEKEKEKKKETRMLLTIDVMSAPLYLISQRIVLWYGCM